MRRDKPQGKAIKRRQFLKTGVVLSGGAFVSLNSLDLFVSPVKVSDCSVTIPLPIQVVIDDVGWWSGHDGSKIQEPYRTGIDRNHVPSDYTAIVNLGKALNIRPQAAMVMCEWDKENILGKLPSSTWMGENWDNSKWVGPWMEEAADIIRKNKRHIELTLHAVGHEYWTDGRFSRAEWADVNGMMRPAEEVEKHLDFFEKIMHQHQLAPFPTSFVPAAFNHGFGITAGHNVSMAEILSKHGINYINTPFRQMYNAKAVTHGVFGFDTDVLTIDRGKDLLDWNATGVPPAGLLTGPTCGMHWANLIHPDPDRNSEIVNAWVKFLAPYNEKENTMLAPDSASFQSQLLYQTCTKVLKTGNHIALDFTEVDKLPSTHIKDEFLLKVKAEQALRFKSNDLKIEAKLDHKPGNIHLCKLTLKRREGLKKATINMQNKG